MIQLICCKAKKKMSFPNISEPLKSFTSELEIEIFFDKGNLRINKEKSLQIILHYTTPFKNLCPLFQTSRIHCIAFNSFHGFYMFSLYIFGSCECPCDSDVAGDTQNLYSSVNITGHDSYVLYARRVNVIR